MGNDIRFRPFILNLVRLILLHFAAVPALLNTSVDHPQDTESKPYAYNHKMAAFFSFQRLFSAVFLILSHLLGFLLSCPDQLSEITPEYTRNFNINFDVTLSLYGAALLLVLLIS